MSLPSVVIVGAGNLAYHLTLNIERSDLNLLQVCNRSRRGLLKIKKDFGTPTSSSLNKINASADVYIIAVSDDAIRKTALTIAQHIRPDAIIAHTSGSQSVDVLSGIGGGLEHGSFYPLQSFKKDRKVDFSSIPVFLSSHDKKTIKKLDVIARKITDKVIVIPDEDRSKLHIPAVYVNNFVNHIYTAARDYCSAEGLKMEYLHPLMIETLDRILEGNHPQNMQTGPAIRGDSKTIKNHRKLLKDHPDQLPLYNHLTKMIKKYYDENN